MSGSSNSKVSGWGAGKAEMGHWGQKCSCYSCCHRDRITGGVPGHYFLANP